MSITLRPLSDRTWLRPDTAREWSRFESNWSATKKLLLREVDLLDGSNLVVELDVREQDFKLDGDLRANARPTGPAAVVAFDSREHGPMLYRADRYDARWVSKQGPGWQQNVRAIALTLEALRTVDRYGATETGQQYQGFKAIGAGSGNNPSHMTRDVAMSVLAEHGTGGRVPGEQLNLDPEVLGNVWRRARHAVHPDRLDGHRTAWDLVEQAAKVLGVHE